MKIYNYKNYSEYHMAQKQAYLQKINNVWATEYEMKLVARHIKANMPYAEFGLCHGVRNGYEVDKLYNLLQSTHNVAILGTELGGANHPKIIQWDFHNVMPTWFERANFIYSNSLDHSPYPYRALGAWFVCLRPGGYIYLQWSEEHNEHRSNKMDPFGATLGEYIEMCRGFTTNWEVLGLEDDKKLDKKLIILKKWKE